MHGLKDRVVLITGGGSGVGRAIVDRFLEEGARIVVLERDRDKVASLEAIGSRDLLAVPGDVTSYADNERAVLPPWTYSGASTCSLETSECGTSAATCWTCHPLSSRKGSVTSSR